jgi:hypothetical protein
LIGVLVLCCVVASTHLHPDLIAAGADSTRRIVVTEGELDIDSLVEYGTDKVLRSVRVMGVYWDMYADLRDLSGKLLFPPWPFDQAFLRMVCPVGLPAEKSDGKSSSRAPPVIPQRNRSITCIVAQLR